RLLLELFVRALELVTLRLELFRLRLEFLGQRLGLLEELFRPHRRDDRVEHDADRLRQLLEERDLRVGEGRERRELDDRHHLVLEEDRQDDDVYRLRLAEPGGDGDVLRRRLGDEDRLALERGLADEALAGLELVLSALAPLVAV